MNKITNETKAGILAAVAIAILIVGYSFLKGNDVFSSQTEFYAKYDNVEGLTVSNPVLINGYQIGRVAELTLQPNGQIIARLNIDPEYEIPKNTIARLESTSLLGGKGIIFELGNSRIYAKDGDTLKSNIKKDFMQQVQPMQKKAENLVARLDSILTSVNTILNPKFQKDVNRSFASIANSLETLESTTKKFDHLVGSESNRLSTIFANLESISNNFKQNNQKINSIMSNLDQVSDNFARANFSQTVENANKAVSDLQITINKINNGKGSLGQLVNDQNLYNNLNNAAQNLDKLMIDLKANPKRYLHFSVFGGKKKD